jgi:hypothetical protein
LLVEKEMNYIPNDDYERPPRFVKIPSTPAPRSVDSIQQDAKERFVGIMWIQKEEGKNIDEYFNEYDYWEIYSENKPYSKRKYLAAYKGVMREYNNYLCILNSEQNGDEYYVIAKRLKNELESLEAYCTCLTCSASMFNPIKYIWCPYCTKCIKSGLGFANPHYIKRAKELRDQADKKRMVPYKYQKYIDKISPMKVTELSVFASIVLFYMFVL